MFKSEDTARFKAAVTTANGGWALFVSVIAVVLTLLAFSGTAIYKAAATENQVETNTLNIEKLQQFGERVIRIEVTVENIREEQEEIKETQEEIKSDTHDILIQLRAMQLQGTDGDNR